MSPTKIAGPDYDARIRRAKHLSGAHSFAKEVLTFYLELAKFQKQLYSHVEQNLANSPDSRKPGGLRDQLDLAQLLPQFPALLTLLESAGPPPVAEAARQLSLQGPAVWIAFLSEFWKLAGLERHSDAKTEDEPAERLTEFILRAFLQPYAEFLSLRIPQPEVQTAPSTCPHCRSVPLLGVLRPEGDGGRRALVCSFCSHEWNFRRILCPACGEDAEDKQPVYVAEQFPHIRVEACETCKLYLRTIDLTKDGNAVAVVDDLAAIPLSLWAHENGYTRIQPNLLST
jgi:FdhE protein